MIRQTSLFQMIGPTLVWSYARENEADRDAYNLSPLSPLHLGACPFTNAFAHDQNKQKPHTRYYSMHGVLFISFNWFDSHKPNWRNLALLQL